MAKNFNTLLSKMSPEAQVRVHRRVQTIIADMPLQELRKARRLSQEDLARTLGIAQPQVSKIEGRTDLYLSTLRRYVEALGGSLDVVAQFAEGTVRINLFNEIEPTFESTHAVILGDSTLEHISPPDLVLGASTDMVFGSYAASTPVSSVTVTGCGVDVKIDAADKQPALAA